MLESGYQVDVLAITDPSGKKPAVIRKYITWLLKGLLYLFRGYRYEVVHVHYVFPSGLIGLLFKTIWHSKMIVTAHGGDLNKMAKKNRLIKKMTLHILHRADHVIAVGQGLYNDIQNDYGVKPEKLSLLSMGVNRQVFKRMIDKDAIKRQLDLPDAAPVILFVGNIIRDKGVLDLIHAFASVKSRYPNAFLFLIGASKNQLFLEEIEAAIKDAQLNRITLLGPKTQQEVAVWMNASDVFVLPSYTEGFGLVALEAMSCGTPVVASSVGGLPHLLQNGCGLLVPPGDPRALSEGIMSILSNGDLRKSVIENGVKRAEEHDQATIMRTLREIYVKQ